MRHLVSSKAYHSYMRIAALAATLLTALIFLVAGVTKLRDRKGFREALGDFGVPPGFRRPVAIFVPVAELLVAGALLLPETARFGAWGAVALLAGFLTVGAMTLARGRNPECHCFGKLHSDAIDWPVLIRIGVLATINGWLALR